MTDTEQELFDRFQRLNDFAQSWTHVVTKVRDAVVAGDGVDLSPAETATLASALNAMVKARRG